MLWRVYVVEQDRLWLLPVIEQVFRYLSKSSNTTMRNTFLKLSVLHFIEGVDSIQSDLYQCSTTDAFMWNVSIFTPVLKSN